MAVTLTFTEFKLEEPEDENSTDYDYMNSSGSMMFACMDEQNVAVGFQPVLYSLIFLLGVVGNGLMITVLLRCRRLLRITEIYLLHLAVADLLLLMTFPFYVVEYVTGWLFGEMLCKLMGLVKCLNLLCGSFLLACIGFDRYLAIVHAIPSMRNRRPRTVHITCSILWLVCLGLSLPNVAFLTVKEERANASRFSCFYYHLELHAHNWLLTNRVFDHVCFFLSLAIMSYCYTAVVVTLRRSQKSQTKQGAIRLALLLTLVFCFCWLPYNITLLIQTLVDLEVIKYKRCESYVLLQTALDLTNGLGYSHSCLNPFLYAFVGVKFRNELNRLLLELGCSPVCLPFNRNQGHSRPSTSDGATNLSSIM
ncbi:C-X-C chemokine receptor type 5 [Solea senegalensis]|uniref:C-X-C chemokine receptor type 5 n=1 Tax=Solea senegalensis TaxID=28829 RepID=A0AAV6Q0L3_SOLSE|nr:C-X-C chemokine receptor type 5 [Solea senegalensis]KAG7479317.1 C-X-C chemokine receptor type 5 [Solea senegalensis]